MALTRTTIRDNIDLVILLVVLSDLIAISFTYPVRTRQVPLIFLSVALVLALVEILVLLLPERHTNLFEVLTEGLASDIEDLADEEDLDEPTTGLEQTEKPGDIVGLWPMAGAITLFLAVSYVFGMLWGIPVFVFTVYWLTNQKWVQAAILSLLLMAIALFGFGNLMHVPVTDALF